MQLQYAMPCRKTPRLNLDAMNGTKEKLIQRFAFGVVVIMTLAGGFLRFYALDHQSFWMDEAFSVQAARAIQVHGVPRYETGETGWGWLPAHYLMAASLHLPWDMHAAARLPSATAGSLMIPLVAVLTFALSRSYWAALMAAFLIAFSVPDIAWSRQARGYIFLQFAGMLGVGSFVWGLKRIKLGGLVFGLVLLALSILTHRAGYLYWLAATGFFLTHHIAPRTAFGLYPAIMLSGLLLVLFVGSMLPGESSQAVGVALAGMGSSVHQPSYGHYYAGLIFDFWGWNTTWMIVGFVGIVQYNWRIGAPIITAVVAYVVVLSESTLWFHVRYITPVLPVLHMAAAVGPVHLARALQTKLVMAQNARRYFFCGSIALWALTSASQNLSLIPSRAYELGPTEPQADWRGAISWLSDQGEAPVTIMCLPVFHDLYLGPERGAKYFLPFTFTGVPGHWQESPSYTRASTLDSVNEALSVGGYWVLDEFSFHAIKNPDMRELVSERRPEYTTPDGSVVIWRANESTH